MVSTLWFLLGCVATMVVTIVAGSYRRRSAPVEAIEPEPPSPDPPVAAVLDEACGRSEDQLDILANGVGSELADLATGIEGNAELLCEGMGEPDIVAHRIESLWSTVYKLRMFSQKLMSFSYPDRVSVRPLRVGTLLRELRRELETNWSGGAKIELSTAEYLPPALADREALRNAVLFVVDTLLALEANASSISLHAQTSVDENQNPIVEIEVGANTENRAPRSPLHRNVQLAYLAARNLLAAQRATLSLQQIEGESFTCVVCLQASTDEVDAATLPKKRIQPPPAPTKPHAYGGVLILEDDRALRNMLCRGLESSGRNLFTCADGASARSLLEATPERFELLILDKHARIEPGDRLAQSALESDPDVKVLMLVADQPPALSAEAKADPRLQILRKPFGLREFRDSVTALLGTPATPLEPARGQVAPS